MWVAFSANHKLQAACIVWYCDYELQVAWAVYCLGCSSLCSSVVWACVLWTRGAANCCAAVRVLQRHVGARSHCFCGILRWCYIWRVSTGKGTFQHSAVHRSSIHVSDPAPYRLGCMHPSIESIPCNVRVPPSCCHAQMPRSAPVGPLCPAASYLVSACLHALHAVLACLLHLHGPPVMLVRPFLPCKYATHHGHLPRPSLASSCVPFGTLYC